VKVMIGEKELGILSRLVPGEKKVLATKAMQRKYWYWPKIKLVKRSRALLSTFSRTRPQHPQVQMRKISISAPYPLQQLPVQPLAPLLRRLQPKARHKKKHLILKFLASA